VIYEGWDYHKRKCCKSCASNETRQPKESMIGFRRSFQRFVVLISSADSIEVFRQALLELEVKFWLRHVYHILYCYYHRNVTDNYYSECSH